MPLNLASFHCVVSEPESSEDLCFIRLDIDILVDLYDTKSPCLVWYLGCREKLTVAFNVARPSLLTGIRLYLDILFYRIHPNGNTPGYRCLDDLLYHNSEFILMLLIRGF